MLLKNVENEEKNTPGKIKVNSERRVKIKSRKIKEQKKDYKMKSNEGIIQNISKEILDKRIKKNSNKQNKEASDKNNGVYFYSGINNYIIKEKYQNNIINNKPKVNKNPIQINSNSTFKKIQNNFNNSNISLNNNNFKNQSINFQKIYPKNNFQSLNNLILKNKKAKKVEDKIYKKKVTNNSLSLSRHYKKNINNTFNTNPNIELSSSINNLDFNNFGFAQNKMEKYVQNSKYLNKGNEAYFKISNISNHIISNNNNSKSSWGNNKIYHKPNRLKKNLTYIHNSFKGLNSSKNGLKISPERFSLNSKREDKEINEKKINFDFMKFNTKPSIQGNDKYTKKKFLLISRQTKELDKLIFSKSIEEPYQIEPRISINKNKDKYNILYLYKKNNDIKNNNSISSIDNIKFSIEKIGNKSVIQNNENNTLQKNYNNILNLPITKYHFFTKENIKICKDINLNQENESFVNFNISNKLLKNNILMNKNLKLKKAKIKINKDNNNNYIPIKSNENKNNVMSIPYVISKDMMDKLNEKIKKNKPGEIRNEVKLTKESYSYDPKKPINKNSNINDIISKEIYIGKDEIEDAKNKRYKLRSVVKVVKKNKKNSYFNQKKRTKEEENEIKEKLKVNKERTEEEQMRNDKVKTILKEDIENFILFYNKNNNSDNTNDEEKKINKYDWSIIEQLIIKAKVDLIDIINSFLEISQEVIDNKDKMKIWNEYLSKIIRHYNNRYLNEKNEKIIHIKMLKILGNIDNICINKKYKFEILGNLFYQFLIEEMFYEEDLNYFENEEQKLVIEIAKVIKTIIVLLSDNRKIANEYHNKFKNTKLFNKNPIYFNYVTKYLKSALIINYDSNSISYNS